VFINLETGNALSDSCFKGLSHKVPIFAGTSFTILLQPSWVELFSWSYFFKFSQGISPGKYPILTHEQEKKY
jgi:hypothetical protein